MSDRIVFDPNEPARIPHGARGLAHKGKTVFHVMAWLWRKAKAEYDQGIVGGAAADFEEYANAVSDMFAMLNDALSAGEQAVSEAGLDPQSKDAGQLFEKTRKEFEEAYRRDHKEMLSRMRATFDRFQRRTSKKV
jgi:hypothetical protein